jgi:glutathione S-transferase
LAEQITASLTMLEALAAKGTFVGGTKANLADITVAVGWFFLHKSMPQIAVASQFPNLVALSAQCETLPAFLACQLEA